MDVVTDYVAAFDQAMDDEAAAQWCRKALKRPPSFGYRGREEMFKTWALGPTIEHRDSPVLDKANRKALEKVLEASPFTEGDDYEIAGAKHWAVGWVDHLSFRVYNEDGTIAEIAKFVYGWFSYLAEQYPIADDNLYSEMEHEAASESWESTWGDIADPLFTQLNEMGVDYETRHEGSSCWWQFRVKDIKTAMVEMFAQALDAEDWPEWADELMDKAHDLHRGHVG